MWWIEGRLDGITELTELGRTEGRRKDRRGATELR